jgi:hypothetical protein
MGIPRTSVAFARVSASGLFERSPVAAPLQVIRPNDKQESVREEWRDNL